jgi:hypothetical protein
MKTILFLLLLLSYIFANIDDEKWAVENRTYNFDIDADGKKDTIFQQFQKIDIRNAQNHIIIDATKGDKLEYDVNSFVYFVFEPCKKGCIKTIDNDWGIWGELYSRYYYYDENRKSWFLKKAILDAPHFDTATTIPAYNKRDTEIIYYDSSKRIDGAIMPNLKNGALKKLEKRLKHHDATTLNSIEKGYMEYFIKHIPITKKNIWIYNNIAYYLQKESVYYESEQEGIYLLNEIIKFDPTRAVAYLNLADAYAKQDEQDLSYKTYQKYVNLMKKQNKERQISKREYKKTHTK